MSYITIAIAKGRIAEEFCRKFETDGLCSSIDLSSRQLIFEDRYNEIQYICVKPSDVVVYVEKGVADLGIVGKDIILEEEGDIYEILDLNIGRCKLSVAGLKGQKQYITNRVLKVATKYPNIAKRYFESRKQKIEIVKLNGSVELAPLINLSHIIVDIVETGNTLKANGLEVFEDIYDISAKLIANRVSYRFKYNEIKNISRIIEGGMIDDLNRKINRG